MTRFGVFIFGFIFLFTGLQIAMAQGIPTDAVTLFVFEKNENPENIMIVHSALNPRCDFKNDPVDATQSLIDFYWLMDGVNYKPVHPMIKSKIRDRIAFDRSTRTPYDFYVRLTDLSEVNHDLSDTRVHVVSGTGNRGCKVAAYMHLGRSMRNAHV